MMNLPDFKQLAMTKSNEVLFEELRRLQDRSLHSRRVDTFVPKMINILKGILRDRGFII